MEFTTDEKQAIIELAREAIAYYHETLAQECKTIAAAMAEFDAGPIVRVLSKLDPEILTKTRKYVEEYLQDYLN